ncbi:MAG: hypothetical protein EHM91_08655, partial [Planctomycetota bacterium]
MRAALLILCLFFHPQDDAFKILQDPARRAKDFDRQTALKAFKEQARTNAASWVAARFLEKSDRQWKLTYDRLKTASGTLIGTADGANFVAYNGARAAVGSGTLEKDVRDPAGVELDAYLKAYWTGAAISDADHRKALEALEQSIAKVGASEGAEALKLFLLVHTSVLGDRASDIIGKFGYVKEGDRWGKREDLAVLAIANGLAKKSTVTGDVESKARSSSAFGPKYAVALFDLSRVFSANQGYQAAYQALLGLAQNPNARVAAHYKALADSYKAAV